MNALLALLVGVLYAVGLYLMMQRSLIRLLVGLIVLAHGVNLLIFVASGLVRDAVPIVPEGLRAPVASIPDPLPQALILTAIVISFGILSFTVVLVYRTYREIGPGDADSLTAPDR